MVAGLYRTVYSTKQDKKKYLHLWDALDDLAAIVDRLRSLFLVALGFK